MLQACSPDNDWEGGGVSRNSQKFPNVLLHPASHSASSAPAGLQEDVQTGPNMRADRIHESGEGLDAGGRAGGRAGKRLPPLGHLVKRKKKRRSLLSSPQNDQACFNSTNLLRTNQPAESQRRAEPSALHPVDRQTPNQSAPLWLRLISTASHWRRSAGV